jgi:hypothetical protein
VSILSGVPPITLEAVVPVRSSDPQAHAKAAGKTKRQNLIVTSPEKTVLPIAVAPVHVGEHPQVSVQPEELDFLGCSRATVNSVTAGYRR